MDKKFVLTGLIYAILGMALGIYMASSKDHTQAVTHAHILLIGLVVSFIYGIIHKLWLHQPNKLLAMVQFVCHQIGAVLMFSGLFVMFGNIIAEETIGPILGVASILVITGMILMLILFLQQKSER